MEDVLDAYHARYDAKNPSIGMGEAARQLPSDVFDPLPLRPGRPRRIDDKYDREGTCSLFMLYNPPDGWRRVGGRDGRTAWDGAEDVRHLLAVDSPDAEVVTLARDNLNTHTIASLYKAFDAGTAGRRRRRLRLAQAPVSGSWLNVAGMELTVLSRQCPGSRRFATKAEMGAALTAWAAARNATRAGTRWRFTTADARIKLKALYPLPDIER
jgi:hypothetical protein